MNQELLTQQWLAEIQTLKQQLAEVQKERDAGWESAEKWRKLYNTESEQRRTDAQLSQQAIASLKTELEKLRGIEKGLLDDTTLDAAIKQEIALLTSVEELQAKLITIIQERDHLKQALKTEQENHEQTRKSLTTALGDAIDRLTQQREET
ncbi:MAG: hypothetical protein QNJ47_20280 [Nostocaceae cyanobacterium]|nr:hypothetical protein [Nostocaceae cyanobacterium]